MGAQPLPIDRESVVDQSGRVRPVWYRFFSGLPAATDIPADRSAAKVWGTFNASGVTAAAYNLTSVTDTSTGNLTANIATDFDSTGWTPTLASGVSAFAATFVHAGTKAAGTLQILSNNTAGSAQDLTSYNFAGYGDQ